VNRNSIQIKAVPYNLIVLSSDLGTTNFNAEIRGSELARWITKAIKNETFIKMV